MLRVIEPLSFYVERTEGYQLLTKCQQLKMKEKGIFLHL